MRGLRRPEQRSVAPRKATGSDQLGTSSAKCARISGRLTPISCRCHLQRDCHPDQTLGLPFSLAPETLHRPDSRTSQNSNRGYHQRNLREVRTDRGQILRCAVARCRRRQHHLLHLRLWPQVRRSAQRAWSSLANLRTDGAPTTKIPGCISPRSHVPLSYGGPRRIFRAKMRFLLYWV